DSLTPVLRARSRQRPEPFLTIDLLRAKPANLSAAGTGQKLQLQNVSRLRGERSGIEPRPLRLDLLDGQHPIAWGSTVIRLEPGGRVRLDDVLRQRPAKHRGAYLPALFGFPPFARVDDGVQDFANVPPANARGASMKDWGEGAPQAVLDRLRGAQTT